MYRDSVDEFREITLPLETHPIICLRPHKLSTPVLITERAFLVYEQHLVAGKDEKAILDYAKNLADLVQSDAYQRSKLVAERHFDNGFPFFGWIEHKGVVVPVRVTRLSKRYFGAKYHFERFTDDLSQIDSEFVQKTITNNFYDIDSIAIRGILPQESIRSPYGLRVPGVLSKKKLDQLCLEVEQLAKENPAYKSGLNPDSIELCRKRENALYLSRLNDGTQIVIKEFPQSRADSFLRERFFLNAVASQNPLVVPKVLGGNLRLYMPYAGDQSMLAMTEELTQEQCYAQAIDSIVALSLVGRAHPCAVRQLKLTSADLHYPKRWKFSLPFVGSADFTLISPTIYQGHFMFDPSDRTLKRIDLEQVYVGPVELSLANLFLGSKRSLSQDFIMHMLDYYCHTSINSGIPINKQRLHNSFGDLYSFLLSRSESAIDEVKNFNPKSFN